MFWFTQFSEGSWKVSSLIVLLTLCQVIIICKCIEMYLLSLVWEIRISFKRKIRSKMSVRYPVMKDMDSEKKCKKTLQIGPEINCDDVENIHIKNTYVCLSCNKRNPVILTISNTFSFIFGSLLDNICCCITSTSKRALVTAAFIVVVVAASIGCLVGKLCLCVWNTFCTEKAHFQIMLL